jgi:hypothetical protein
VLGPQEYKGRPVAVAVTPGIPEVTHDADGQRPLPAESFSHNHKATHTHGSSSAACRHANAVVHKYGGCLVGELSAGQTAAGAGVVRREHGTR